MPNIHSYLKSFFLFNIYRIHIRFAQSMNRIFVIAVRTRVDFPLFWLTNQIPNCCWHKKKSIEIKLEIDRFSDSSLRECLMKWRRGQADNINHRQRNQRGIKEEMIEYVTKFFFSKNKEVYVMNGMNGNHRGRSG